MPVIELYTNVSAAIEVCFDLSLNIDIHMLSTKHTNERAVSGKTSGLINEGEYVTWEAVHFGIRQQLTTYIEKVDRPFYFTDRMVKGAFSSFYHEHIYKATTTGTLMIDKFSYEVPYGIAGKLFDKLVLNRYMTRLLTGRNNVIKQIAESDDWPRFCMRDQS